MEWLNYHHLLYFYVLGREGRLAQAAKVLKLSPQAVLGQVRTLESALGVPLLEKQGRRLVMSSTGRRIHRIADDIFALGQKVLAVAQGAEEGPVLPLRIGASDAVPKLLVRRLLQAVWHSFPELGVVVHEGPYGRLVAELQLGDHDVILTDGPVLETPGGAQIHNHTLSASPLALFAPRRLARGARAKFPACLSDLPLVVPTENSMARRTLNAWLSRRRIEPRVLAETEDSALLKLIGSTSEAAFLAPLSIEQSIREQFDALPIGEIPGAKVEYCVATRGASATEHPAIETLVAALPLKDEHRCGPGRRRKS